MSRDRAWFEKMVGPRERGGMSTLSGWRHVRTHFWTVGRIFVLTEEAGGELEKLPGEWGFVIGRTLGGSDAKPVLDVMASMGFASRRRRGHIVGGQCTSRMKYMVKAPLIEVRSEVDDPPAVLSAIKAVDDAIRFGPRTPSSIRDVSMNDSAYRIIGVGLAVGRYEVDHRGGLVDAVKMAADTEVK